MHLGLSRPGCWLVRTDRTFSAAATAAGSRGGRLRQACERLGLTHEKRLWAGSSTCLGAWAERQESASCQEQPGGSWSDLGQEGSMGTEDMTEPDQLVPGQGAEQKKSLDTRLWVLNLLKNTLFGFLLFLDDYRKCDPQEHVPAGPTLGCQLTLSALGVSPLPPATWPSLGPSVRPCVRVSRSPTWRRSRGCSRCRGR